MAMHLLILLLVQAIGQDRPTDYLKQSKCKQSKAESSTAQNALQKEITTLRDTNRTLQLKLRDIEVQNDDFERQARNTTSSLEDLESKYNIAIERDVIFEEEIRAGEQEREALRIETQRLRDELSDLKVEAEIRQDKLRSVEALTGRSHLRRPTSLGVSQSRPQSSVSVRSPSTTASSPTLATPPTKSASSTTSDAPTPPSPPVSDRSLPVTTATPTQSTFKPRLSVTSSNVTPRAGQYSARQPRYSSGPSTSVTKGLTAPSTNRRTTLQRPESRHVPQAKKDVPSSTSLTHIRGLIGKMQNLEQRVNSARSRLPAPSATTPRSSPRPGSALSQTHIPSSVTVRSQRKRTGGSVASGLALSQDNVNDASSPSPEDTTRGSRPSIGIAQSSPMRDPSNYGSSRPSSRAGASSQQSNHGFGTMYSTMSSRPGSRQSVHGVNGQATTISNRPKSRQSVHGVFAQPAPTSSRPSSRQTNHATVISRPASRQSITGARTPLGQYSNHTTASETRARPQSSHGGSYASSHGHRQSASVSRLSFSGIEESPDSSGDVVTPTPSRRTTIGKEGSGIPVPGAFSKRQSGTVTSTTGRRTSSGLGVSNMGPPLEKRVVRKKISGLGETF